MTNIHRIKRRPAPAARVSGLTGPAVLLFAPWMQAPPALNKTVTRAAAFIVPALNASPPAVDVSIYPAPAPRRSVARGPFYRGPWTPGPSRYSGGIYSPARLDDPGQPNELNGSKAAERPERPERVERLKVTRTNDPNDLNGLNDLKQAHRYSGGAFQAERLERLN